MTRKASPPWWRPDGLWIPPQPARRGLITIWQRFVGLHFTRALFRDFAVQGGSLGFQVQGLIGPEVGFHTCLRPYFKKSLRTIVVSHSHVDIR